MRFIGDVPLSEFDGFEKKHPLGRFMQTREQLNATKGNKKVGCIGVQDNNGELIAGAYYFVDHARLGDVYSIKGGPLLDYHDEALLKFFIEKSSDFFKKKGAYAYRITPPIDYQKFDNDGKSVTVMNENVIQQFKSLGFAHFLQKPITDNQYPVVGLGYEYRKDLRGLNTVEELRASYQKQTRTDIRRAEKFGVYIDKLTYDQLSEFKEQTEITAERRDFHDKPLDFYQRAYKEYGDDVLFLMVRLNLDEFVAKNNAEISALQREIDDINQKLATKQVKKLQRRKNEFTQQIKSRQKNIDKATAERQKYGQVITLSGGMFYIEPQEVAYMFSFNNRNFGNYHGQYLLQDYMLRLAIQRKIPTYNFYMVTGTFDANDGVYQFKRSFDGATYQTIGWFEKAFHPFLSKLDRTVKALVGHSQVK